MNISLLEDHCSFVYNTYRVAQILHVWRIPGETCDRFFGLLLFWKPQDRQNVCPAQTQRMTIVSKGKRPTLYQSESGERANNFVIDGEGC